MSDDESEASFGKVEPIRRPRTWSEESDGPNKRSNQFEFTYGEEEKGRDTIYSDWTITVKSENSKRTFQVHKPILAAVSDYFKTLFEGACFAESALQGSTFEFTDAAVAYFHKILQFAYGGRGYAMQTDSVSVDEICTMFYLCDYFQIESAQQNYKKHLRKWQKHILCHWNKHQVQNVTAYYRFYQQYDLSFLREFVIDWGAVHIGRFYTNYKTDINELWRIIDTETFLDIFQRGQRNLEEKRLGDRLLYFCKLNKLDANTWFDFVESSNYFPVVSLWSGIALLDSIDFFSKNGLDDEMSKKAATWRDQCMDDMISVLVHKITLPKFDSLEIDKSLPPSLVEALLERSMKTAKKRKRMPQGVGAMVLKLREAVEEMKLSSKDSVPLHWNGGWQNNHSGQYFREGDRYIQYRTDAKDRNVLYEEDGTGVWRFSSSPLKNRTESEYEGLPPFHGWNFDRLYLSF